MIGKIRGIISEIEGNIGLIETNSGVFYQVYLPPKLLKNCQRGDQIEIYTYLQVKQDGLILFGFENRKQFQLFEMLLLVDGVGPKSAFNIVCFQEPEKIIQAAKENDVGFFCSIPGIGKKSAQKILLELSGHLKEAFQPISINLTQEDNLIIEALVSLGFRKSEAIKVITKIDKKLTMEEKIKQAIRLVSKS